MNRFSIDATSYAVSIIIPAYNEEQRLPKTLQQLAAFFENQHICAEIIVVDDGSTDGTASLCESLEAHIPGLRTIKIWPNRGKGHAVRVGMLAARGFIAVMFDADSSMSASELPKLLAPIERGEASISTGSRYMPAGTVIQKQPLWRRLWSRMCNFWIQKTLVPGMRDTQCGFKAFTAQAAQDLFHRATIDGWAFDLEILGLAKRLQYSIVEVPVTWKDDNRSRVRVWKDLFDVIKEAITIKRTLDRIKLPVVETGKGI